MYILFRVLVTAAIFTTIAYIRYVNLSETLPTSFINCLRSINSNRSSYLVTPSSSTYNNDRVIFNKMFVHYPDAIFHPASEADAAAAVTCAASHSVFIVPRSGGHSFEGHSGGSQNSLVINLDLFQHFSIDHDTGIATVGAGHRLGSLYTKLWTAGEYLVPAGTCPGVGVGGHALGGGIGMLGRKYGVLSDNVVGMTVVAANGEIWQVNATSNPELFWALRGAGGGSFGLVTEFRIQAYKSPPKVTTIVARFPWSEQRTVMHSFGTWLSNNTGNDLSAMLYIGQDLALFLGTFLGPKDDAQMAVAPLLNLTGPPQKIDFHEGTWYQAAAKWATLDGTKINDPIAKTPQSFRLRSLLYRKPMSGNELTIISRYLNGSPNYANNSDRRVVSSVMFDTWGGRIDFPNTPSAFDNHRGVLYSVQYGVQWRAPTSHSDWTCAPCMDWIDQFAQELQVAYSSGPALEAYQNYIERDIPNGLHAYYGDNLSRLIEIKKSVDPNNNFVFPQAIPMG